VDERHRGLYKAQVYGLGGALRGRFEVPADRGLPARNVVAPGRAYLVMGVSDLRGLGSRTRLQWDGAARDFAPGVPDGCLPMGIQVDLGPVSALAPGVHAFEVPLDLRGSQDLSIAPVAGRTDVKLGSNWATPSFGGRFLPTQPPQVGAQGFDASWQVSQLARNLDAALRPDGGEVLSVSFIEPVNVYLKVDRATKYALLFISLTFAAFFLFEVLERLPVHPMQYGLVGVALAMFFLLLVSLSEHLPFHWAYVAASGACILLLGSYLVHVLRSRARGWGFAGALTLLYGVLYGLLVSEDNALLMGSILLFGALAAVMTATRKIDWYALGETPDRN
jgi:inner membrane protein